MIGNKKVIAVCVARIQDDATNDYITALNDATFNAEYGVLVYNTNTVIDTEDCDTDAQFYVYNLMDYSIIDAVIIVEEAILNKVVIQTIIQNAKSFHVPVIIIGEQQEGCINIKFDQEKGFEAMVRHMIEDHHMKKAHFMAGMRNNVFSDRRLGVFKNILEENNLPFDDSMVSYGDFWSGPAAEATERLVASDNLPEAIICANDSMAIAVCGVLNKHGIQIPEQVAVTGFDGIPEIQYSSPKITSASCNASDIAEKTVEVLENLEKFKDKTETFTVPARINLAESCGCKEKKTQDASRHLNSLNDRFYLYQDESIQQSALMAKIQCCESVEQVAELLHNPMFYDMCCLMEANFLEEHINPEEFPKEQLKDMQRDMIMLYEANHAVDTKPYAFPLNQIVPAFEYCLDNHRVIILTALHHMGVPMGYISFFFNRLDHTQASRVTQIANAMNAALGGYRNNRYRNFLTRQIEEMYRIDSLTGLYNRRGFALAYQKMLEWEQKKMQLTIILADLDRLKYINDTFGHKEGDFAIRAVADTLRAVCPEGSLFTRFGGDEMLAVCIGKMNPEEIREDFSNYFKQFNECSGKTYEISASIGIYITEENDRLSFEELIEKSDRLMYEEKERHRKRVVEQLNSKT